ncbi:LysR family transcriptional regulator [Nitratireductor sp. XY-223]|uniref:LysR family transcriptional regulator n=1 Tax=Nitratireductor sp. XY-223 TaxID=2561926 RepID=UPI0010AAA7A3|nr:LysR family transcriptional regulator [Nitratireductor sp. XY-223]
MNWDDLRIALAVQQTGTYLAAAARLQIDETTVSRRMARLEKSIGFTLFDAVDGVRQPTPRGAEMLRHAVRMSGEAAKIAGLRDKVGLPTATFRLATTDSIAVELLGAAVPPFLAKNPGLRVELLASTENVNFSRWEADFAIRPRKPEKGDFIITKLGDWVFYLFTPKELRDIDEPLLCAYPEGLDASPESQFLIAAGLKDKARCLSKNLLVIRKMLETGLCSGILPSFVCQDLVEDDRFDAQRLEITREIWLLMQPHLKQEPSARAFVDWIKKCFAEIRV